MTKPKLAPDPDRRQTRQLRVDNQTWQLFQAFVGAKQASPTLRKLIGLYLSSRQLQQRVTKAADPSPDRRHLDPK